MELVDKWVSLSWNGDNHGDHVEFINKERISCSGGDCSIVMDPMIISNTRFKKIVYALTIHEFGSKACFGFIDYQRYQILMNDNWNKCYLHCSRNGGSKEGIYGLSAKLKSPNLYCCVNGQFINSIKLNKNRNIDKEKQRFISPNDSFIFEIVFNDETNNGKNYCNVYLDEISEKTKLVSPVCDNGYTFENIPNQIVPIFSHQQWGQTEVTVKVLIATFAS